MNMLRKDIISIVIPCYRQAHLLPKAIQSCIDQTYPHLEIIVIDDGSPDNVQQAIKPYSKNIRLIQQKNQGLSAARNTGLKAADGRFIKFLDADDWLLPHCIEKQYYSLVKLDKYISVIGHCLWYENSSCLPDNVYPNFDRFIYKLCYVNSGPPHTFLFPTAAVRKLGGFDMSSRVNGGHEDYDLLCRLAINGYDVVVIHTIGCVYRQYEKSMSTNLEGMSKSRSRVWQYFATEILKKDCDAELLTHLLGGYIWRLSIGDFRYECMDILKKIVARLQQNATSLSHSSAFTLCSHITSLRMHLPRAKNDQEKISRQLSIELSDSLSALALVKIPEGPIIKVSRIRKLLAFANSYFWVERGHYFKKLILKIQAKKSPKWILHVFFKLLQIPTLFFPTKTSKNKKKYE